MPSATACASAMMSVSITRLCSGQPSRSRRPRRCRCLASPSALLFGGRREIGRAGRLARPLTCGSLAFRGLPTVTLLYRTVTVDLEGRAISVENLHVSDRASSVENVTVGGRMREYLTEKEVDRLMEAAKGNRWGHRDATAILIAYRHGLIVGETVADSRGAAGVDHHNSGRGRV
jgi:hypothetical protein